MLMRGGSVLILCSLISAGKEGQEILGPEARAEEVGCTGTLGSLALTVALS